MDYICKWLTSENEDLEIAGVETPEDFLMRVYQPGVRFNHNQPTAIRHVVGFLDDAVAGKTGERYLVIVYKRWDKHNRQWAYESEAARSFILDQLMTSEFETRPGKKVICPLRGPINAVETTMRKAWPFKTCHKWVITDKFNQ